MREAKGNKDRVVMLPRSLAAALRRPVPSILAAASSAAITCIPIGSSPLDALAPPRCEEPTAAWA